MAEGFKSVEVNDPQKLETFITGVTGSVMAIMSVRNYLKKKKKKQ